MVKKIVNKITINNIIMNTTIKIFGIVLSLVAVSCGNNKKNEIKQVSDKPIRVETQVVKKSTDELNLNFSGLIIPKVTTQLSFQLPGQVNKIYTDEGDFVKKGELLAELDNKSFVSAHKAAFAMKTQAEDAYKRLKRVYEKGSLPEIQWEDVKSKLEQANSAEQVARNNIENCRIIAPSSGVIGTKSVELGSSAIPGVSALTLLDINNVYIKISVPENEVNKIKKGQDARIVIPAINQKVLIGKVKKIGVIANVISKTYEVKILLENGDHSIKPGMVCDVNLSIPQVDDNITIPSQAVVKESDNKTYVYLVDKNTKSTKKQEVVIGEFVCNRLAVLRGLQQGDIIIVNGQHKLKKNSYVAF